MAEMPQNSHCAPRSRGERNGVLTGSLMTAVLTLGLLTGCRHDYDNQSVRSLVIHTTNFWTGEPLPGVKLEMVRHEQIGWTLQHKRIVDEVKTTDPNGDVHFNAVYQGHQFIARKRGYDDTVITRPADLRGRFAAYVNLAEIDRIQRFTEEDGHLVAPLIPQGR